MADKSREFRKAKEQVFKRTLEPAGFVKGKYLFVRKVNGQFHGFEYQTSKLGGAYFVNIAFHYDFLQPFGVIAHGHQSPHFQDFRLNDFMLYSRLEDVMPKGYPKRWHYSEGQAGLEEQVDANARDGISALDSIGEKWKDPNVFLELLPPKVLREDKGEEGRRMKLSPEEVVAMPPLGFNKALGPGWGPPDYFGLGYYLGLIALRAGRVELAREYLSIAEEDIDDLDRKALEELRRQIEAKARGKSK